MFFSLPKDVYSIFDISSMIGEKRKIKRGWIGDALADKRTADKPFGVPCPTR